jgi:hypothetical protein
MMFRSMNKPVRSRKSHAARKRKTLDSSEHDGEKAGSLDLKPLEPDWESHALAYFMENHTLPARSGKEDGHLEYVGCLPNSLNLVAC